MLLLMSIVLISVGTALMMNIYSIFSPFIENLGDIKDYNIAYYGANAALERAQLALRYQEAGFEGRGGWDGSSEIGKSGVEQKEHTDYGRLANGQAGLQWQIKGINENGNIPAKGDGNVDLRLRERDSSGKIPKNYNYNKLDYNISEEFILGIDNTSTGDYYSGGTNIDSFNGDTISGTIRLPQFVTNELNELCDNGCDVDGNGITNDIMVNWGLQGTGAGEQFSINPTIDVNYSNDTVNNKDTAIREDVINNGNNNIKFTNDNTYASYTGTNPVNNEGPSNHNIIPADHPYSGDNFNTILNDGKNLSVSFSLVNLLKTQNENIYPFLEYSFDFCNSGSCNVDVPSRFFKISGNAQVGDYNVQIKINRPTTDVSAASDFTILF